MTAITMFCDKESKVMIGFELKGHAGFSKRGKDIVCASLSALAINVQNSIEKFCEDRFDQSLGENGGYMKFMLLDKPSHDASLLLASAYLGFKEIADEYEKFVILKIKEV